MSAAEIAASLARLRGAGAALRRRPARERLASLAAALERWRDPASGLRRALEKELPDATGFSPEVVREGLQRALDPWSGHALLALAEQELAERERVPCETSAAILGGALPMPSILAVVAPLAAGAPVLVKPGRHDPVTARAVAADLAAHDAELGACVAVVDFPGGDAEQTAALCQADCVAVTGSDETVAAVAARVGPPRRLVAHGHRFSVAALGPSARPDVASRLALDTVLWDQLGCLSPIAVYAVRPDEVFESLAGALAAAEARWPRGRVPPEAAAAAANARAEAEMRGVPVRSDPHGRWTVIRERDARTRPAPLHRFLRIHPVPDASALFAALRPQAAHLAAVALEGFGDIELELVRLGASRVCPPGRLQAPPLDWRRDGCGVLTPFLR